MPLVLVHGMPDTPNACAICGGNAYDEVKGEQQDAIWAEGIDIDWGNSLYICLECAHIIANLIDRATQKGFDKVVAERDGLKAELEVLQEKYDEAQGFLDKIREGAAARKKLTERVAAR